MRAVVLMTALPPTMGHLSLVRFAHECVRQRSVLMEALPEEVVVVITDLPSEPVPAEVRAGWLAEALNAEDIVSVRVVAISGDETDPQRPDPALGDADEPFWDFWAQTVAEAVGEPLCGDDFLVSSESYGPRLAQALDIEHVWYDPDRVIQGSRATDLRTHPIRYFSHLVPPARRDLRLTVALFGAESVGKTTLARHLGAHFRARVVPEWARTYLEREPDPAPTPERMLRIMAGQAAAQVVPDMDPRAIVVRDTDLLSTIGYCRILGMEVPRALIQAFEASRADLYLLMSSDTPYVADPLRYGGDRRESTDGFWMDLLREHDCTFRIVTGSDLSERQRQCERETLLALWRRSPLWRHVRR